jgi:hypothetical protein
MPKVLVNALTGSCPANLAWGLFSSDEPAITWRHRARGPGS